MDEARRSVLRLLSFGSAFLAFLVQVGAAARAFVPNVLYEPPRRFKLRKAADYPEGVTFEPDRRLFVIREDNSYHVISAVCTHLGCTVQWKQETRGFDCPCHGSRFHEDGVAYAGPAPRPLCCYAAAFAPDGHLEVDTAGVVTSAFRIAPSKVRV